MDRLIKALIVEKKDYCLYFFSKVIRFDNFQYEAASTVNEALDLCEKELFHLIILNLDIDIRIKLPEIIKKMRNVGVIAPIVIVADRKDAEKAIKGMKSGACNVIFRPFINIASIKQEITGTLNRISSMKTNEISFRHQDKGFLDGMKSFCGIVGTGSYIRNLYKIIKRIAPIDVNILIIGESGTGKELIAKAIHAQSSRSERSFVAVNCSAIPEGLIESSFFGYEKGAFTGADKKMTGYFEEADKGTFFMDEIGAMSHKAQSVLLRVLQEQKYIRVGGTKTINTDARIIASTNKNLRQAAENDDFRTDLYYRLNVVSIKTVPLRERKEDIPLLIDSFIKKISSKYGFDAKRITPQATALLESYHWPGNVRELENCIESVIALISPEKGMINSRDIEEIRRRRETSSYSGTQSGDKIIEQLLGLNYEEAKKCFERHYFLNLLKKNNGNITHSAQFAKIHPATLHRKINHLQIRS